MVKKLLFIAPDSVRWIRKGTKTTAFSYEQHEGEREVIYNNRAGRILRTTFLIRKLSVPSALLHSPLLSRKTGLRVMVTPIKRIRTFELTHYHNTEGEFSSYRKFDLWLEKYGYARKVNKKGWIHKIEVIR